MKNPRELLFSRGDMVVIAGKFNSHNDAYEMRSFFAENLAWSSKIGNKAMTPKT